MPCLNFLFVKSLSWEFTSIISHVSPLLSSPFLFFFFFFSSPFFLSGHLELYPWRSYRYEEKDS